MSAAPAEDTADLLAAARGGESEAFQALIGPHLPALHVHAYRMLGSLDDADDAIQDVLLSAWRALGTYQGQAPLLHWLYRITTTSSLKVIRAKARRPVLAGEIGYLQPYPGRLLDQLTDADADPAAIAERRESVALAFIIALQRLPARQRAALILHDVLAWSASEVAGLLDSTVPAVNSALQRARATLSSPSPADPGAAHALLGRSERQLLDRFIDAWQRCDIDALAVALANVHGPRAGLALLGTLGTGQRMANTHRLESVRAHLLEQAGETAAARDCYLRAATMTANLPEQRYLQLRAAHLGNPGNG